MKILVIGHSVEDQIHYKDKEIHGPGGIFYSVMGMRNFLNPEDKLSLLTSTDSESAPLFSFLYDTLDKDYFETVDHIPKVHLYISETAERCETYENLAQSLSLGNIKDFTEFDGILINMITGSDVSLHDMLDLRKRYHGLIYLDLHTLARGVDENNRRLFRPIPEADKWVSSADIIQVNENELMTLSSKKDELEAAEECVQLGIKYLIVTKGEAGNTIYFPEMGKLNYFSQKAIKTISINKVGCGDVFGAVFFSSYIKTRDIPYSAKLANTAAGCVTTYSNVKDLVKLKDDTFTRLN